MCNGKNLPAYFPYFLYFYTASGMQNRIKHVLLAVAQSQRLLGALVSWWVTWWGTWWVTLCHLMSHVINHLMSHVTSHFMSHVTSHTMSHIMSHTRQPSSISYIPLSGMWFTIKPETVLARRRRSSRSRSSRRRRLFPSDNSKVTRAVLEVSLISSCVVNSHHSLTGYNLIYDFWYIPHEEVQNLSLVGQLPKRGLFLIVSAEQKEFGVKKDPTLQLMKVILYAVVRLIAGARCWQWFLNVTCYEGHRWVDRVSGITTPFPLLNPRVFKSNQPLSFDTLIDFCNLILYDRAW